jgi:hypothetical protein
MVKKVFRTDRYRRTRGGYSRLLQISCEKCGSLICCYQKDGSGSLRRMYLDRMSEPKISISAKTLSCPKGHILGVKTVYEKESRPAYRLFVEAVRKKIISA